MIVISFIRLFIFIFIDVVCFCICNKIAFVKSPIITIVVNESNFTNISKNLFNVRIIENTPFTIS